MFIEVNAYILCKAISKQNLLKNVQLNIFLEEEKIKCLKKNTHLKYRKIYMHLIVCAII